jgi:hypothetical protein
VEVRVLELDLMCDIDYQYDYGLFHGTGMARATTRDNSLSTTLDFRSSNWSTSPPQGSSVESCQTSIEITNMEFFGDFVSNMVEIFEGILRGTIEEQIENLACEEWGSLGTSFVSDILDIAGDVLGGYTGSLGSSETDPLYLEQTSDLTSSLNPLDLQDNTTFIGSSFQQALEKIDALLGATVPDPDGGSDLGINIFLRKNLLDSNRALTVEVSQIPGMDPVIFRGHNRLMETTVRMNRVDVVGLDSLTTFDPIQTIGGQTLQTAMTWGRLQVEFAVTVEMKPSSLDDAILQNSTSTGISENVVINFSLDNVEVLASLFVVVDEDALGNMQIGQLLHTDNLFSCLLSVIKTTALSGLSVNPQAVNPPTLSGFSSPGIEQIATAAVETAFAMYEGALRLAIPNIFQTSIRRLVNREILEPYRDSNSDCPVIESAPGFVDFRDLLLPPATSRLLGGKGTSPYGDLFSTGYALVQDLLFKVDRDTGRSAANNAFVGPLTRSQSNSTGSIVFPGEIIGGGTRLQVGGLDANVRFRASDFRIHNLDTLGSPLAVFEPIDGEPHQLNNTATFGGGDRPLHFGIRLFLLIGNGECKSPMCCQSNLNLFCF